MSPLACAADLKFLLHVPWVKDDSLVTEFKSSDVLFDFFIPRRSSP